MLRAKRLPRCERRSLPRRLKAEIILRQNGCCADCGTRLIMGFFTFDHRPPLALRDEEADPNDPTVWRPFVGPAISKRRRVTSKRLPRPSAWPASTRSSYGARA